MSALRLAPVLSLLFVSATAEAAIPKAKVTGGTPAQRAQLQKGIDKLPPCFKSMMDDKSVEVRICNGSQNAFWVPTGYTDTTDMKCPEQIDGVAHIEFDSEFFGDSKKAGDVMAKADCINRKDFQDMPPEEIILHEVAHGYQEFNGTTVDGFLAAGFAKKFQQYRNDPRVQAKIKEMRKLSLEGKLEGAARCKLNYELWLLYKKHGLAIRNPSDMHASDVDLDGTSGTTDGLADFSGSAAEYWAMVVQMYASNGWKFCATLNEAEKKWFASNMAECMRQFPTPDCMKNRNAFGRTRPGDGGVFLRP